MPTKSKKRTIDTDPFLKETRRRKTAASRRTGKPKPFDKHFDIWFVGFVDAGASFDIDADGCPTLMMRRREDDLPMIREVARRFGGTASVVGGGHKGDAGIAQWRIGMSHDLEPIMEVLDTYGLRTRTKKHYAIWKRAVIERQRETPNRDKILTLREKLRETKRS
jgi:hypothetical protein